MPEYPIEDYGLIGNCETAALVNGDGGIDWLCVPSFDAPSLFGALLDRERGGAFSIRPVEAYRVQRRYVGDSAILETRFVTARGVVRLTDFFVVARQTHARFYDFTSLHPTRKLVRLVELEAGPSAEIDLHVAARPDYARRPPAWRRVDGGVECAEAALFANLPLVAAGGDIALRFTLEPGRPCFFVLDSADRRHAPDAATVHTWLSITTAFWRDWNLFNYYRGPHQQMLRRSAVTLKLLSYAPSGAIVAAPTTSLPERLGGELNWDYRFTWVRDTALFINAFFRLGYSGEAKAYFEFVTAAPRPPSTVDGAEADLPILLPIREDTSADEETLSHLDGYGQSRPVRRGNRAEGQLQLDNYGHFLQSLFYWTHTGGSLDAAKRAMAADALAILRARWSEPDNGIWEPQDRQQRTYSKVSAWLAFQRAGDLGLISVKESQRVCAEIHAQTLAQGLRERDGRTYLAEHYGGDVIDATALLAFTTGFLPTPLARDTREEIERRLAVGPWLYRSDTHRQSGEGAFVLCSLWRVGHLIREGDLTAAEASLDQIIASASPLGLYAEEIDPRSGAFLGNYPQAFSHLGLIAAILDLEQAKAEPGFAGRPDHEKFQRAVGRTIGVRGVLTGFWRVPRSARLIWSRRSKWREP
ncbi:MAG: glycoside hydrolase family 15 protein [Acidobacteria bacterium]|nr:glycoside hydrolase family 15 protein [Acidobacteriota bacterium]